MKFFARIAFTIALLMHFGAGAQRYTPDAPRHLLLKTNAVGWSMLISNIEVEYELSPRWSLALPIYYGACNYFARDVKFRTQAFCPEARYWFEEARPGEAQRGWFVGPHLGLAWFDMAIGGSVRYQDHKGHTPAFGAGVSAGWRTLFGRDRRWGFEASLGVGVYRLFYDKWDNVRNGRKLGEVHKVLPIIDNVSLSFSYSFSATK